MEDKLAKEIAELFSEIEKIASENIMTSTRDWLICTPHEAGIIMENNRRKEEKIKMLEGAIEGWRRADNEQLEIIATLESWIKAEISDVKRRASKLMSPF